MGRTFGAWRSLWYAAPIVPLDKATIRRLGAHYVRIKRQAKLLSERHAEVDRQTAAIRQLVPPDALNSIAAQTPAIGMPVGTWRDRIVACLGRLGKPARPKKIADELTTGFDDRRRLRATVTTELRRMLCRDDPVIEKLPRSFYRLIK